MRTHESILELIGRTPLLRLRTGIPENGPRAYVKLEFCNPTGSLKDRICYYILKKARDEGRLKPGDTVEVEIEKLGTLRNPVVAEKA